MAVAGRFGTWGGSSVYEDREYPPHTAGPSCLRLRCQFAYPIRLSSSLPDVLQWHVPVSDLSLGGRVRLVLEDRLRGKSLAGPAGSERPDGCVSLTWRPSSTPPE